MPVNSVVSVHPGVVTDKRHQVCLFLEFGSTSGVHSCRPSTSTKFPSFRFILVMMGNVSAGLLYRPIILKMALSIQLHAHLMTSTSTSALLSWQKRSTPELQHSVRKVRSSMALAMAPVQNLTFLSNSTSHAGSNPVCTPASSSSTALFFFTLRGSLRHCQTIPRRKNPLTFRCDGPSALFSLFGYF